MNKRGRHSWADPTRVPNATALLMVAVLMLAGCSDHGFETEGGSSYAEVSRDINNPCRVFVKDMGRSAVPVKSFSALIEGCKP